MTPTTASYANGPLLSRRRLWLWPFFLMLTCHHDVLVGAEILCSMGKDGGSCAPGKENGVPAANGTGNQSSPERVLQADELSAEPEPPVESSENERSAQSQNVNEEHSEEMEDGFVSLPPASAPCLDLNDNCEFWALDEDRCLTNPRWMLMHCPVSCEACGPTVDVGMGEPQMLVEGHEKDCLDEIIQAREYINLVWEDPDLRDIAPLCGNEHEHCAYWASKGQCVEAQKYMFRYCAPMCQTCEHVSVHMRCPLDPNAVNVWNKPGDLDFFFANMTTHEAIEKYQPRVWSRPSLKRGDTEKSAEYSLGPWVVTLENFLTEQEAQHLIQLGVERGYKASTEYGEEYEDGSFEHRVSDTRTSTNAWCQDECAQDPVAAEVMERVAALANMPTENSEYLQLLRYEVGQYYETHHDYSEHELERQQGVRILTVFLYLNDVEEGGETNFPHLDITVKPKVGRVVVWPSVLDDDPDESDSRTEHQALPVIKGVKYAANAWFHARNYRVPFENDCTS